MLPTVVAVEFMLLAAPRSGTTWAANWLTTDTTLCLHDPLFTRHYTELDGIQTKKRLGLSCTGLALFPDWVNAHPARKIVLHRDINEINESLESIGLSEITVDFILKLESIEAIHLPWTDLFERPKFIYEHLLEMPFDEERHALLKEIEMQPNFEGLTVGRNVTKRLMGELRHAAREN